MNEISVKAVRYGDRKHFVLRYKDPMTGKLKTRSARTTNRRDAERAAAKWEAELREGRYAAPSKVTWADFRERYAAEVLTSLAVGTDEKAQGVFNLVERILSPARAQDVTAQRLSYFQSKLREEGRSESTIAGYLAHLKAALRWGARIGLVAKAPEFPKIRRAKGSDAMKGRPITTEEFERMLDKVEAVVGAEAAPAWKRLPKGLWLSGLRLNEALQLSWDDETKLRVDLAGQYPMLLIPAELEKGHKDRLLPITPDFAETLEATPANDRTGYVFRLPAPNGRERPRRDAASRVIMAIGKAANVKVNSDPAKKGRVKYASAHDLRRSFGERWAGRVMPQVLKEMMRHESIETTQKYYVGRNAQATAKLLWEAAPKPAAGNTSGNKRPSGDDGNRRNSLAEAGIEPARGLPPTGF